MSDIRDRFVLQDVDVSSPLADPDYGSTSVSRSMSAPSDDALISDLSTPSIPIIDDDSDSRAYVR